jgi:hypothetical protein
LERSSASGQEEGKVTENTFAGHGRKKIENPLQRYGQMKPIHISQMLALASQTVHCQNLEQ